MNLNHVTPNLSKDNMKTLDQLLKQLQSIVPTKELDSSNRIKFLNGFPTKTKKEQKIVIGHLDDMVKDLISVQVNLSIKDNVGIKWVNDFIDVACSWQPHGKLEQPRMRYLAIVNGGHQDDQTGKWSFSDEALYEFVQACIEERNKQ